MIRIFIVLMFVLVSSIPWEARADDAVVLPYAGRLVDANDAPVTGTRLITFSFYDSPTVVAQELSRWQEEYEVEVRDGLYSVRLGNTENGKKGLSASTFNSSKFLELVIAGERLSPRAYFGPVAAAYWSTRAAQADAATLAGRATQADRADDSTLFSGKSILDFQAVYDNRYARLDGANALQTLSVTSGASVGGNLAVTGDISAANFGSPSDGRLKTRIEALNDPRPELQTLHGIRFDWNERARVTLGLAGRGRELGLVAQDVARVFPELVRPLEDGTLTVDYARLSAVLVEAIKAQDDELQRLNARLKAVEQRLGPANGPRDSQRGSINQ